jgi:hypothetical protein
MRCEAKVKNIARVSSGSDDAIDAKVDWSA